MAIFESVVRKGKPLLPFRLVTERGLCPACLRHHLQVMAEARKHLWDNLPTYFELPPWGELKNDI